MRLDSSGMDVKGWFEMRNLFVLVIVAAAAFAAGWFTVSRDGEHTTIQFNREEIRNDARMAIDRGREILNKQEAGQSPDPSRPWPENRTAANPQSPWNQPAPTYPPNPTNPPSSFQSPPWQQPFEWQQPGSPSQAPAPQQNYPVPRQY